jgi:hypothetical protein
VTPVLQPTNTPITEAATITLLPSPVPSSTPLPTAVQPTLLSATCHSGLTIYDYCGASFDGRYLAVIRQQSYTSATAHLVDVRTRGEREIGRGYAVDVVWSPTAEVVLVNEYSHTAQRTFLLDATTLMTTELPITAYATTTYPYGIDGPPRRDGTWTPQVDRSDMTWSPDGRQIALINHGLYVADADGSHLRPVGLIVPQTFHLGDEEEWMGFGGPPIWSKDGKSVSICYYYHSTTPLHPSSSVPHCLALRVDISSGKTTFVPTPTP